MNNSNRTIHLFNLILPRPNGGGMQMSQEKIAPLLSAQSVCKQYSGVNVLKGIDFFLCKG